MNISTVQHELAKSEKLGRWIADAVNGLETREGIRHRLAGGCFSVGLDHHAASLLSTKNGLISSALALLRCQYDAYLRGCWLAFVANEESLDLVRAQKELMPKDCEIIEALEELATFQSGALLRVRREAYSTMCDYNHTGIAQITRNQTEEGVGPAYDDEEVIVALQASATYALLTVHGIANLAQIPELAEESEQRLTAMLN